MNLQENKLPLIVRRRLHELDEILGDLLKNTVYATHEICTYSNSHQLIEHITYSVINEHMYYMYFEHIDDTSKEWESLYRGMEEYLVKKYGDKLEKYYERMCGNRNTNLDESIRRILIQETGGIDPFIRRRIDLKKFREMFDQGKNYMFYESDTSEEFKWKLVTATLENYLYYKSGLDIDVSDGKYNTVINNLIDLFDGELESIYKSLKKDRGMDLKEDTSKTNLQNKLLQIIKSKGLKVASKAVNGYDNLINLAFDGDKKEFFKSSGQKPYTLTKNPSNLYFNDLMVDMLELPTTQLGKKELGDFYLDINGNIKKFDLYLGITEDYLGIRRWKVIGESETHDLDGFFKKKLNDTLKMDLLKQVIDKYNLNDYKE